MSTRLTRVAVAAFAGASLLFGAAPLAEAAGPEHRHSHRGHSHRGHSHRGHSHHRHSYGHRHHHHSHSHRHYSYPGRSHYHRHYNPYRFHRPHYKSYHSGYSYPSYSISFGFDSCGVSSIYTYGTGYAYPAYTYPTTKYYDPYCRPYSSGVYLSYGSSVTTRSLTHSPAPVRIIDASDAGPTEIGFELLAAGEHSRAMSFFADASSRDLEEPFSKLGYSLASAALGQDDRALWAMQNAMKADAASLAEFSPSRDLARMIDSLKDRYQQKADRYVHTPDKNALFMVAALNHVTGDADGAKAALARAYPGGRGFYDPATRALADGLHNSN